MHPATFISQKLQKPDKGSFSYVLGWIALSGIAIGIFVILISFSILFGFQTKVTDKIISFGGHLQITLYDLSQSYESKPIRYNTDFRQAVITHPGIRGVQVFALKAALVQSKGIVLGVLLKGVDQTYDTAIFAKNIIEGRMFRFSDSGYTKEILISKKIAHDAQVKIGDDLILYFMQNPPRARKLTVCGIYETGMEEFDEVFILGDLNLIRRVNHWPDTLIGGYEILLHDIHQIDTLASFVYQVMDYEVGLDKITDKYITIFDWLELLQRNVLIFLIIIVLVACFNMASTLLIMITERTHMIGILKALGASNYLIAQIFYFNGIWLICKGMLLGNGVAILFCGLQYYFKLIPLDPENYYMNSVPIYWDIKIFFLMNVLLFSINALILWIPLWIITTIKPLKAIRFS